MSDHNSETIGWLASKRL